MEWEAWAQSENPYGEKLPGKYEDAPEPPTAAPAEGEKAAKPV